MSRPVCKGYSWVALWALLLGWQPAQSAFHRVAPQCCMTQVYVDEALVVSSEVHDGFAFDPDPSADFHLWRGIARWLILALALVVLLSGLLVFYNRKLRLARRALQNRTAQFEAIFESTPDATLIFSPEQRIRLCNSAFRRIFGYREDEILGRSVCLIYQEEAECHRQQALRFNEQAPVQMQSFEAAYRRRDGSVFPGQSMGCRISSADTSHLGYILVIRDISEQKRSEQAIIRMALTDPLTGLANRHRFNQYVEEQVRLAQRRHIKFSLVLLDLDLFKAVNDTHGHPVGDELLQRVGLILRGIFRDTDLIARIGGDEFAVILPHEAEEAAIREPVERVIQTLAQPLQLGEHSLCVGASAGAARFPRDARDGTELYRCADRALYQAKHAGRGRLVVAATGE